MDKSWITKSRWCREYIKGVESFLDFADQRKNISGGILCPCKSCINRYFHSMKDVKDHLLSKGFFPGYVVWNRHGEERHIINEGVSDEVVGPSPYIEELPVQVEPPITDDMEGLLRDTFAPNNDSMNLDDEHAEHTAIILTVEFRCINFNP